MTFETIEPFWSISPPSLLGTRKVFLKVNLKMQRHKVADRPFV
jgi:hypothetical protein